MIRTYLYLRGPTEEALDLQRLALTQYACNHGLFIAGEFSDQTTLIGDMWDGLEMLKKTVVQDAEPSSVLCLGTHQLSRNLSHLISLHQYFDENNIPVYTVMDSLDEIKTRFEAYIQQLICQADTAPSAPSPEK